MPISFDQILMNRAKEMAKRGMKPGSGEEDSPQEVPQPGPRGMPNPGQFNQGQQQEGPQDASGAPVGEQGGPQGQGMNPVMGALMRRMQPPPQEGADPRMFLNKLPKEIADLAIRYRRI